MSQTTIEVLDKPDGVAPFVELVTRLADQHKDQLGFLPFTVYNELAASGRLWIAKDYQTGAIAGYLAFGGSHSAVRVFQLYVEEPYRGCGVGRQLLDRLKVHARASRFQVIAARVAADLAANLFWERNEFFVVRQVAGGKTTARTINVRVHELEFNSLIPVRSGERATEWLRPSSSDPVLLVPMYVLDLNVLFDVVHNRPSGPYAERVLSAGFNGDLRLCVSHEFRQELQRRTTNQDRDPLLRLALALPTLPPPEIRQSATLVEELRQLVFPLRSRDRRSASNDESDLTHLASCIANKVRGFVTRELAILKVGIQLNERYDLEVLSPFELVTNREAIVAQSATSSLHTVDGVLSTQEYANDLALVVEELLTECDVDSRFWPPVLDAGTSTKRRVRLIVRYEKTAGFVSWSEPSVRASDLRCYLFVQESHEYAQLVIDHLLGRLVEAFPTKRLTRCELTVSKQQVLTRSTARLIGFQDRSAATERLAVMEKLAFNGWITPLQWSTLTRSLHGKIGTTFPPACPTFSEASSSGVILSRTTEATKRTVALSELERALAPFLLITPGRAAAIVPIREKLAFQLLPRASAQQPLFAKEAILRLERAYFGGGSSVSSLLQASVVVFYVSGADKGRGEAIGIARVTSSGAGSPLRLGNELIRQGVFTAEELNPLKGPSGHVHYFTFDSYLSFPRPVAYRDLKRLGCVGPANLITSQVVGFEKLVALLEAAEGS